MTWETVIRKPWSQHILRSTNGEWGEVREGLVQCLKKLCSELPSSQPLETWDGVLCELWISSGRAILSPCARGYRGRERIVVQFCSQFLQDQFDNLPDSETDPAFERRVARLSQALRQSFDEAVIIASPDLQRLQERRPFELLVQFSDELDSRQRISWVGSF